MTIFIALCAVVFVGIGVVFWLLKNDKDDIESSVEKLTPDSAPISGSFDSSAVDALNDNEPLPLGEEIDLSGKKPGLLSKLKFRKLFSKKEKSSVLPDFPQEQSFTPKKSSGMIGNLFSKFKKNKEKGGIQKSVKSKSVLNGLLSKFKKDKSTDDFISLDKPTLSIQDVISSKENGYGVGIDSPASQNEPFKSGTAGMTTAQQFYKLTDSISNEEETKIEKEVESSFELLEIKKKYENLDRLFKEKSELLAKAEESLNNELGTQKDFNKVKDVLEKEIKGLKDQLKESKTVLSNTEKERENLQKRINQLEEKATKLEKEALKNQDEIELLNKKLAAASQAAVQVMPTNEEQQKEPVQNPSTQEAKNKIEYVTADEDLKYVQTSEKVEKSIFQENESTIQPPTFEEPEPLDSGDDVSSVSLIGKQAVEEPAIPSFEQEKPANENQANNQEKKIEKFDFGFDKHRDEKSNEQYKEEISAIADDKPVDFIGDSQDHDEQPAEDEDGDEKSFLSLKPDVISDPDDDRRSKQDNQITPPNKEEDK